MRVENVVNQGNCVKVLYYKQLNCIKTSRVLYIVQFGKEGKINSCWVLINKRRTIFNWIEILSIIYIKFKLHNLSSFNYLFLLTLLTITDWIKLS